VIFSLLQSYDCEDCKGDDSNVASDEPTGECVCKFLHWCVLLLSDKAHYPHYQHSVNTFFNYFSHGVLVL